MTVSWESEANLKAPSIFDIISGFRVFAGRVGVGLCVAHYCGLLFSIGDPLERGFFTHGFGQRYGYSKRLKDVIR